LLVWRLCSRERSCVCVCVCVCLCVCVLVLTPSRGDLLASLAKTALFNEHLLTVIRDDTLVSDPQPAGYIDLSFSSRPFVDPTHIAFPAKTTHVEMARRARLAACVIALRSSADGICLRSRHHRRLRSFGVGPQSLLKTPKSQLIVSLTY